MNVPYEKIQENQIIDQYAISLLDIAEYFRTSNPPKYKMAIKCVKACFKTPISQEMNACASFELGKLYFYYTRNIDLAKFYLEQAYRCMKELGTVLTKNRIETACLLSEVYMQLKMYEPVKQILKEEVPYSREFHQFYAWLLFLLAEAYGTTGDWYNANEIISTGITIFEQLENAPLECFFRLSQALVKTLLKNTKTCLRQLQSLVQTMKSTYDENTSQWPLFDWMGKETLTALTYLLTVIQSIHNCQMPRAYKYHTIALRHINDMRRLMVRSDWPVIRRRALEALAAFEIILFENIATAQLMVAKPYEAISVINVMVEKMRLNADLFNCFEPQLHTLLGIYCWSVRLPENAERQFQAALRTAKDTDTWIVINLSLAIVYLLTCKGSDFYGLFERITPGKLQSSSPLLKASAHFVHALHSYLQSRLQEAKSHLTDSVTIVRDEGAPRIQALATLLSAKLVSLEAPDMLLAANNWAVKSADNSLILWSNHLIYELQLQFGHTEQAQFVKQKVDQVQQRLNANIQQALLAPAHSLIQNGSTPVNDENELIIKKSL
ncbi:unnamed protein product [Dracunculus medinensis]|uniref:MAU2 chromatid cohesion factor homolog n=1 Tax=Dracunculus medinensis TaxID=318479 RepID=A0A0N4U5X9_DRAME|nr:unnamed protein product [Dracunculus medinensis]